MTEISTHIAVVGAIALGLGLVHVALRWGSELAGASLLNREVSDVHCSFIGLTCLFWGLLPLAAGPALLEPHPVTRLVLLGAVAFWASRLVIQFVIFNSPRSRLDAVVRPVGGRNHRVAVPDRHLGLGARLADLRTDREDGARRPARAGGAMQ